MNSDEVNTEDQAMIFAEKVLLEQNICNMGISAIEKAGMLNYYTFDTISEGWRIVFALNDGNSIPIDLNSQIIEGALYFETDDYSMRWKPEWIENDNMLDSIKIKVHKLVLTNVLISVKDDDTKKILIPAWLVFFDEVNSESVITSVFAVNAIDGSRIDLSMRMQQ